MHLLWDKISVSALFDICMELQSLALSVVAALFISWERFSLAGEGKPSYKKIQKVGFFQLMVDPLPLLLSKKLDKSFLKLDHF